MRLTCVGGRLRRFQNQMPAVAANPATIETSATSFAVEAGEGTGAVAISGPGTAWELGACRGWSTSRPGVTGGLSEADFVSGVWVRGGGEFGWES